MKTVRIGKQVWTKRNLKVDHYRNGDIIPEVQDPEEWSNLKTGAWCYYDNSSENGKKYGKLYNWYAVNDPRGLAPKGFHIPTKKEFEILKATVKDDGNSLKSKNVGKDNGIGTNTSGFSALLSGCRNGIEHFTDLDILANYWSFTEYNNGCAHYFRLYYNISNIYSHYQPKNLCYSVRLIKDL